MINDTRFIFCTGLQIVYSSEKKKEGKECCSSNWCLVFKTYFILNSTLEF